MEERDNNLQGQLQAHVLVAHVVTMRVTWLCLDAQMSTCLFPGPCLYCSHSTLSLPSQGEREFNDRRQAICLVVQGVIRTRAKFL